jgi:NAD+ diphosphatase
MNRAGNPPSNAFTGLTLDRVAERRDDREWLDALGHDATTRYLVLDPEARLLADATARAPRLLSAGERAEWLPEATPSLLGVDADGHAFMVLRATDAQAQSLEQALDVGCIGLRRAGIEFAPFEAGLFAYASGLVQWQARTRYCPACGGPLALESAGHRARCTRCGMLQFPRSDPAIIVIVEHNGACLLGRQPSWPQKLYSTLAGFVEPGESLEDAVRREVAEETGVEVIASDYHSSQPWPFPASLMLGFTAQARSRGIELRDGEIEHADWFTPDQIVRGIEQGRLEVPSPLSVSWQLIAHWMHGRAGIDLGALCEANAAT